MKIFLVEKLKRDLSLYGYYLEEILYYYLILIGEHYKLFGFYGIFAIYLQEIQ